MFFNLSHSAGLAKPEAFSPSGGDRTQRLRLGAGHERRKPGAEHVEAASGLTLTRGVRRHRGVH